MRNGPSTSCEQQMTDRSTIDYEKLVAAYWDNLTTVLRGFSAAEFEFLETWVPDDDDATNILSIIEAAAEARLPGLSLYLGAATLQNLDLATLQNTSAELGTVQTAVQAEGLRFDVIFEPEQLLDIHPFYRERLAKSVQSFSHEGILEPLAGLNFVQASCEGVKLMALVDSSEQI